MSTAVDRLSDQGELITGGGTNGWDKGVIRQAMVNPLHCFYRRTAHGQFGPERPAAEDGVTKNPWVSLNHVASVENIHDDCYSSNRQESKKTG
jgi:hypothetical protein